MRLLDFSKPFSIQNVTAFPVKGSTHDVCVIPEFLTTHIRRDGTPVFNLEAIRGITPFSNPKPYGMLEIQLSSRSLDKDVFLY